MRRIRKIIAVSLVAVMLTTTALSGETIQAWAAEQGEQETSETSEAGASTETSETSETGASTETSETTVTSETSETTEANSTSESGNDNDKEAVRDPDLVDSGQSPKDAKVLVIDPGHCKKHPGASGNGLKEEVVVLDISQSFRDELLDYADITVYMTRETSACCKALGLGDCLTARSNYAKQLSADFLVSVHINAGKTKGANALVAYKSGYHDAVRKETQKFGKIALKKLSALGIKNRGFLLRKSGSGNRYSNGKLKDYYAIVRHGVEDQIPAVIMEHGYITNSSDCKKFFKTKAKRAMVGKADAEAVISYFGLYKKTIAGEFVKDGEDTYYKTAEGKKIAGWVKKDGAWYHLDENTGKLDTGFLIQGDEKYYLNPSTGQMQVGWFTVDGNRYLAKGNGSLVMGTMYSDGYGSYLFDAMGSQLKKGIHIINNNTYYVKSNKKLASGLTKIKGNKYYFNKSGYNMETGWKKISGKYYYFDEETGEMQKSKWIGKYYVNKKGVRTKKKKK